MKKSITLALLGFAFSLTAASAFGMPIAGSAYWSFNSGSPGVISGAYTTVGTPTYAFSAPDEEALPGTPIFRIGGTHVLNGSVNGVSLGNFTSSSGTVWPTGRSVQFERDDEGNSSINNSFVVAFDSTGFEDFQLEFQYRLTSGMTYGISAIEYSLDDITYQPTGLVPPSTGSGLTANSNWHQLNFDFSALTAIENQSSVYLRFSLPDMPNIQNSFKVDNVELTSIQIVPEPNTLALILIGLSGIGAVRGVRRIKAS